MFKIPTPRDIEIMAVTSGRTMGEVCKLAGIGHNTFSRWKHGTLVPTIVTVNKLLAILQPVPPVEVPQIKTDAA